MVGRILNNSYIVKTYTAGETLEYGQAVYNDGGKVKKVTDGSKPVLGFVARTEHDKSDNISADDTVHVFSEGEITLKTESGLTLTGANKYDTSNGQLTDDASGLTVYGVQAISKLSDAEAHVRVSGAINVIS